MLDGRHWSARARALARAADLPGLIEIHDERPESIDDYILEVNDTDNRS